MDNITLYVDGACPSNGKQGASMYWSLGIKHNGQPISNFGFVDKRFSNPHSFTPSEQDLAVTEGKITNQVAELHAILTALRYINEMSLRFERNGQMVNERLQFTIFSDSEYAIGAAGNNKVRANRSLVSLVRSMLNDLRSLYGDEFINICKCDREYIAGVSPIRIR